MRESLYHQSFDCPTKQHHRRQTVSGFTPVYVRTAGTSRREKKKTTGIQDACHHANSYVHDGEGGRAAGCAVGATARAAAVHGLSAAAVAGALRLTQPTWQSGRGVRRPEKEQHWRIQKKFHVQ